MTANTLSVRPAGQHAGGWLVADIGGTNARFALADPGAGDDPARQPALAHAAALRVREHATLQSAIEHFLERVPAARRPRNAMLAVASAVTGDEIRFTNSDWNFSIAGLRSALGLDELLVVNDFAAAARAVPTLAPGDLAGVGGCVSVDTGAPGLRVVLGPGTGLGLAALVRQADGGVRVMESEGGHISFAPRNEEEDFILDTLRRRFGRVSYERLLGGEGWLNLYQAWSVRLAQPQRWHSPEEVSRAAQAGDVVARAATRSMASILGAFAGDAVLVYGAWQGVYLAGGLLSHLLDGETAEAFRESFIDKGRFSGMLKKTPVLHIVHPDLGNLGAAALAADWLRARDAR
jgi:glucokinase